MAMQNPQGRANYEPNSWPDEAGGPRESPEKGFTSYPADEEGPKVRVRSETFADHYGQARQFHISQTEVEQTHIANALVFELSKVEHLEIRTRMASHTEYPPGSGQNGRERFAHPANVRVRRCG